jgi:redox-sensitive bicupin YhaK (pirin superfamily)
MAAGRVARRPRYVHQDVDLHTAHLKDGDTVTFALRPGRYAWMQIVRGQIELNGQHLKEGDGAMSPQITCPDAPCGSPHRRRNQAILYGKLML